jgi:hypothetical protein
MFNYILIEIEIYILLYLYIYFINNKQEEENQNKIFKINVIEIKMMMRSILFSKH